MPLHIDEFQQPEFQGYVENVPKTRAYLLERFLPTKPTKDINFAYNVINNKYAQAASITGFNAGAPVRDKQGLEKHFGSVAKLQHGFRLDEEEILRFNRPRDDEERDMAVEYVYDQTDNLITGVYDAEEFLRAQALYAGALTYNDTVNDIQLNVDFGIPAENKLTVTKAWSDPTSTPLEDIQAGVDQFKAANNNKMPVVIHMTGKAESYLLKNQNIKYQVYGNPTDQRLLTKADIQNVFTALGLPPYAINDDVVDVYGTGATQLLADNKVVFLGENLGQTFIGPTVEKNFQTGVYVVPVIQETNPPKQEVFVGETAFPALQRTKAIVHLTI